MVNGSTNISPHQFFPPGKVILFYTSVARLFRTTGLGHLFEIAQSQPVVLLAEELDEPTSQILRDKSNFPYLLDIIPVRQFSGKHQNLLLANRAWYKLAKKILRQYRPAIIIACDMYLFDLYLMRLAAPDKPLIVSLQTGAQAAMTDVSRYMNLVKTYQGKWPNFVPVVIRRTIIKFKDQLSHALYYKILPMTIGQKPFSGLSSIFKWTGSTGMRQSDYYIVLNERNYNLTVADGLPPEKIYILPHPLTRATRQIFARAYHWPAETATTAENRILTIMYPEIDVGFRRTDGQLISAARNIAKRQALVKLLSEHLPDWTIYLKPHPTRADWTDLKKLFAPISQKIEVVAPSEPADKYIAQSRIILGLPPASTTIYTASLQHTDKIILSLNLQDELFGDLYRDYPGINYITKKKQLIGILEKIARNPRKLPAPTRPLDLESNLTSRVYSHTIELLKDLYLTSRHDKI